MSHSHSSRFEDVEIEIESAGPSHLGLESNLEETLKTLFGG